MYRTLHNHVLPRTLLTLIIFFATTLAPARATQAALPIADPPVVAATTTPEETILIPIVPSGFATTTLAMTLGQAITWRNETEIPQVVEIQLPTDPKQPENSTVFIPLISGFQVRPSQLAAAGQPRDDTREVAIEPGAEVSYTVTELGEYRFLLRNRTSMLTATVATPDHLVLFHVGNQEAPLGSTLTIDLMAYDPEGSTLHYGVTPLPLLTRMKLDLGAARFTFRPTMEQIGSHTLTFTVTDGEETASETIRITVSEPESTGSTVLNGRILDANNAEAGTITPLVGATVRLVDNGSISAITDSDGYFQLAGLTAGENYVEFDGSTATPAGTYGAYRSKQVLIGNVVNTIDRPIYIMAVDMAGQTMLDPNNMTTVNNPNVNTTMVIPPQTVRNDAGDLYTGPISISEVPADFTPSSLPGTLDPGMVLTIQPMGLTFAQPAPITLPNIDNLPAGSEVDIWSMDHETAQFFIAGKGVVSADGTKIETVEGGIRESSWHFPMSPVVDPTTPPDGTPDNIGNGCQASVSSTVDIAGGCLRTEAMLPTYTSLGEERGLAFIYNSERAYPRPFFAAHFSVSSRAAVPPSLSYTLSNFGGTAPSESVYIDTSQFNESRDEPVRAVAALDGTALATAVYPYEMQVTSHYARSNVSAVINESKIVVNERNSAFGSGWGLAGLQRLYPQIDNTILLTNGDGSALRFKTNIAPLVGSFDGVRGASFATSSAVSQARLALEAAYPGTSFRNFNSLTPDVMQDTDLLYLEAWGLQPPLSLAEQQAVFDYVKKGGCAVLLIDHYGSRAGPDNIAAYTSFLDIFGMQGKGLIDQTFRTPIDNLEHPLTNGPFGRVRDLLHNATGGITDLGPYAAALAKNEIGASIAVIDPSVIVANSGGVVVYSDANIFTNERDVFSQNRPLFLNTISFCLNSRLAAATEFLGPEGDFSTISKAEDSTYTRRMKDGTIYTFNAAGYQTAMTDRNGNRTTYVYDANDRLIRIIDPTDQATTLTYANGKLHTIADPQQRTTTFTHDGAGNLTQVTFPDGSTQHFGYDNRRLMTSETDARGQTTYRQYNQWGQLVNALLPGDIERGVYTVASYGLSDRTTGIGTPTNPAPVTRPDDAVGQIVDGEGRTTRYTLGPVGFPATVTDPAGFTTTIDRDKDGNPLRTQLPSGAIFAQRYDERGNLLSTLDQTVNGTTSYVYEATFNQVTSTTDPLGNVTTFTYDATGNLTKATTPLQRTVQMAYNSQGLPTTLTDPLGTQRAFTYDAAGNPTTITNGSGATQRTTTLSYTLAGYPATLTDPLGNGYGYSYDDFGRVTQETLPGARTVSYGYDAEGNLIAITPPGRPAHTFTYDSLGEVIAYTPPAVNGVTNPATTYAYNKAQQPTKITRPDGKTSVYSYDGGGRLSKLSFSRGDLGYSYSATTGQLSGVSAPGAVELAYAYNGELLTGVTWRGPVAGNVGYTYDANYRITQDMVNGNAINYSYDADDSLTQAGDLTFVYTATNGLLAGSTLGSINDRWSYNQFGESTGYAATANGASLYAVRYDRDKLGRITTKTETVGGMTTTDLYRYDAAQRLDQVARDGVVVEAYSYDANGNRLTGLSRSTGAVTGSYDNQDRLLQYGNASYNYTANGELLTKAENGQTTTYSYDELGNLTAVTLPDGTQITYLIDGQNRRIGKQVNGALVQGLLYQDQLNPVAEVDAAGNVVSRFVYGNRVNVPEYMVKAGITYRLIADHLGSVRLVVDTVTGTVAQRLDYDAFGNVMQDTNPGFQPFGFAGGLYDTDTGLVRFGARDYDPVVGRWTAKDPIGFATADTNIYTYGYNNPTSFVDINGEFPLLLLTPLLGGVINGALKAYGAAPGSGLKCFAAGFIGGVAGTIIGFGAGAFNPILGGVVGDVASEYITQSLLGNRVGIGDYLFSGAIGGYSGFLGGKIGIGVRLLINRKSGIAAAVARTAMNRTEFLQANQAFRRYQNLHSSGASEFAGTATTSVSSGVINGAGGVQCDCQ